MNRTISALLCCALTLALAGCQEQVEEPLLDTAVTVETAQTRYSLGLIPYSDVLTAQDNVATAQSTVDSAWRDLFTARNNYRWAVEYGLIQGS